MSRKPIPVEFFKRETADAIKEWMKGYRELQAMASSSKLPTRVFIKTLANGTHLFVYTLLRLAVWANRL